MTFSSIRQSRFARSISLCLIIAFMVTMVVTPKASYAQEAVLGLPQPGTMVNLSSAYMPLMITGLTIHPENPLLMDFIVSTGNSGLNAAQVKQQSGRLIKYFLACLTIPENNQWVNLSPYEKDRIIPDDLGQTVLGRDMLAQDYILKQLTASLIYPERNLGKNFWDKVYAEASQRYGTTEIPVNTFNKVWILPDTAKVYVHNHTVFVVKCHLKVMLDEDYLALQKHSVIARNEVTKQSLNTLGSQIVRQVILPAIEQEVNTGKNFSQMRQIYNSMVLAFWFKNNLKQALLNQVYTDKSKVNGVNVDDPAIKEKIYQQYLEAYKKGVFNYIKEETDPNTQETIPRKYFSGGLTTVTNEAMATPEEAMEVFRSLPGVDADYRIAGLTQVAAQPSVAASGFIKSIKFKRGEYVKMPLDTAIFLRQKGHLTPEAILTAAKRSVIINGQEIPSYPFIFLTDKNLYVEGWGGYNTVVSVIKGNAEDTNTWTVSLFKQSSQSYTRAVQPSPELLSLWRAIGKDLKLDPVEINQNGFISLSFKYPLDSRSIGDVQAQINQYLAGILYELTQADSEKVFYEPEAPAVTTEGSLGEEIEAVFREHQRTGSDISDELSDLTVKNPTIAQQIKKAILKGKYEIAETLEDGHILWVNGEQVTLKAAFQEPTRSHEKGQWLVTLYDPEGMLSESPLLDEKPGTIVGTALTLISRAMTVTASDLKPSAKFSSANAQFPEVFVYSNTVGGTVQIQFDFQGKSYMGWVQADILLDYLNSEDLPKKDTFLAKMIEQIGSKAMTVQYLASEILNHNYTDLKELSDGSFHVLVNGVDVNVKMVQIGYNWGVEISSPLLERTVSSSKLLETRPNTIEEAVEQFRSPALALALTAAMTAEMRVVLQAVQTNPPNFANKGEAFSQEVEQNDLVRNTVPFRSDWKFAIDQAIRDIQKVGGGLIDYEGNPITAQEALRRLDLDEKAYLIQVNFLKHPPIGVFLGANDSRIAVAKALLDGRYEIVGNSKTDKFDVTTQTLSITGEPERMTLLLMPVKHEQWLVRVTNNSGFLMQSRVLNSKPKNTKEAVKTIFMTTPELASEILSHNYTEPERLPDGSFHVLVNGMGVNAKMVAIGLKWGVELSSPLLVAGTSSSSKLLEAKPNTIEGAVEQFKTFAPALALVVAAASRATARPSLAMTVIIKTIASNVRKAKFGTSGDRGRIDINEDGKDANGKEGADFNIGLVEQDTKGIAEHLLATTDRRTIIIGYDARHRNPEFSRESARIMAAYGFKVIYIANGSIPTPVMAYLTTIYDDIAGVINFTASHSPHQDGGIKFSPSNGGAADNETTKSIEKFANSPDRTYKIADYDEAKKEGVIIELDSNEAVSKYVDNYLIPILKETKGRDGRSAWQDIVEYIRSNPKFKLFVDPLQGAGVAVDQLLYQRMAVDVGRNFYEIIHTNNKDPFFKEVGGAPQPAREYIQGLVNAVKADPNAFGIAQDGDVDRFGVVDKGGEEISANRMMALFAWFLKKDVGLEGYDTVVKTVASSDFIVGVANYLGLKVVEVAVGFKYIVNEVINGKKVLVGGEESAHVGLGPFMKTWDDGFAVGLTALWIVAKTGKSLGEYQKEIEKKIGKQYATSTATLREDTTDQYRKAVNALIEQYKTEVSNGTPLSERSFVKAIEQEAAKYSILKKPKIVSDNTKDGLKLIFNNGDYILMRPSGTEPAAKWYVEVTNPKRLNALFKVAEKFMGRSNAMVAIVADDPTKQFEDEENNGSPTFHYNYRNQRLSGIGEGAVKPLAAPAWNPQEHQAAVNLPEQVDRFGNPVRGGIDLNSRTLHMESSGDKMNITFDPVMIAQFRRGDFSGIKFRILDVTPVSLIPLLGLKEEETAQV